MVVLDSTIVNIALPSAQRALHFSTSDREWIVTAYALAFGSLLLLGGKPVALDRLPLGTLPHHGRLPGRLAEAVQQQWGENSEDENPGRDQHRIHERVRVAQL